MSHGRAQDPPLWQKESCLKVIHSTASIPLNQLTRRQFMQMTSKKLHSRRAVLRMMGAGGALVALAACTPPTVPSAGQAAGGAAKSGQAFLNYWTGWSGFEFD